MKLTRSEVRGVHVFACEGELGLHKGDAELLAEVDGALEAGAKRIVLDLARLSWLDSAGIGAVVACGKRAADRAAIVRVVSLPDGAVRKILVATHLHRVFDLFDDRDAALEDFAG